MIIKKILIVSIVTLCLVGIKANAETQSDLKKLYNLSGSYTIEESDIIPQVNKIEVTVNKSKSYNSMLKQFDISIYQGVENLDVLTTKISDLGANNGSAETLLNLYSNYKSAEEITNNRIADKESMYQQVKDLSTFSLSGSIVNAFTKKSVTDEDTDIGNIEHVRYPYECKPFIMSNFGVRVNPTTIFTTDNSKVDLDSLEFNTGMDMLTPKGTRVISEFKGKVAYIGEDSIYGKYIVIDSGKSIQAVYCNLDEVSVEKDTNVDQYATIGTTGINKKFDAQISNFKLFVNGVPVNPNKLY